MNDCKRLVAEAISNAMATIREDVRLGNGSVIEADAVLLNVAYNFCTEAGIVDEERETFLHACDLDELLPSEAFHV